MTQAHWIRDARYVVELVDEAGDTIKRFYARSLHEIREGIAEEPAAVLAKANNLRTGRARVMRVGE